MTISHHAEPVDVPSLTAALGTLRARGMRVSAARRTVLEALFDAERPVTAEEIAGGLGGRLEPADLASVYRNLVTLEELGIVRHVHLGHGPGLYTRAGARPLEYVVCERCGAVAALRPAALVDVHAAVRDACGYAARFSHFPIVGLCGDCAIDSTEETHADR